MPGEQPMPMTAVNPYKMPFLLPVDQAASRFAAAIARGGISGILEVILAGGLVTDASDIHLEPEQNAVRLRYRLDGVLQDVADFPLKIYTQLVSRLKLVSGMKLNIKQSSQDGRYSIALNDSVC